MSVEGGITFDQPVVTGAGGTDSGIYDETDDAGNVYPVFGGGDGPSTTLVPIFWSSDITLSDIWVADGPLSVVAPVDSTLTFVPSNGVVVP